MIVTNKMKYLMLFRLLLWHTKKLNSFKREVNKNKTIKVSTSTQQILFSILESKTLTYHKMILSFWVNWGKFNLVVKTKANY
jgi:NurA-like 5'-3' nuclease